MKCIIHTKRKNGSNRGSLTNLTLHNINTWTTINNVMLMHAGNHVSPTWDMDADPHRHDAAVALRASMVSAESKRLGYSRPSARPRCETHNGTPAVTAPLPSVNSSRACPDGYAPRSLREQRSGSRGRRMNEGWNQAAFVLVLKPSGRFGARRHRFSRPRGPPAPQPASAQHQRHEQGHGGDLMRRPREEPLAPVGGQAD